MRVSRNLLDDCVACFEAEISLVMSEPGQKKDCERNSFASMGKKALLKKAGRHANARSGSRLPTLIIFNAMTTLRIRQKAAATGKHDIDLTLERPGQPMLEAHASVEFALTPQDREELRCYMEDYGAGQTRFNIAIMYCKFVARETSVSRQLDFLKRSHAYAQAAMRDFQSFQGRAASMEVKTQEFLDRIAEALTPKE